MKVLFRGNGIDLSLPGVPAEKGFATYGKFLLEVIALRDNAASQLERKGRLMDLFVRAEKKDGKWTATDIMPYVEGYLLQLSDQKKARGVLPEAPASVGRPKRKRGGQKTYDTNADKKLADKWETAKRNGAYKAEFARDNGYRVKEFDRLLNRVRASKAKT